MDFIPLFMMLSVIGLSYATLTDYDYGGVPLWINRFLGEPSVLSLRGRLDSSRIRAESTIACPMQCDCPIQWTTALYCDQRELGEVPRDLPTGMQYLFLQKNNISAIPHGTFVNASRMRWLFLDQNELRSELINNKTFENLNKLEILFMNYNNLTSIPIGLPHGLRQLRMAHNQIQQISLRDFTDLKNLSLLLLQGNRLKTIGEVFTGLLSINLLDLSHNHLKEFPKHLPSSLQQLYLSNNSISSLKDDSLQGFHSLQYVRLNHNHLRSSELSSVAFNLTSLVELDLSYNQLTSLPVVPTTLQYLYLEANLIQEFNLSNICPMVGPTNYSKMRILRLDGNKLAPHQLPADWSLCLRVLYRIFI